MSSLTRELVSSNFFPSAILGASRVKSRAGFRIGGCVLGHDAQLPWAATEQLAIHRIADADSLPSCRSEPGKEKTGHRIYPGANSVRLDLEFSLPCQHLHSRPSGKRKGNFQSRLGIIIGKAKGVSACIMDFVSRFDLKLAVLVGELMKSQTSCADPFCLSLFVAWPPPCNFASGKYLTFIPPLSLEGTLGWLMKGGQECWTDPILNKVLRAWRHYDFDAIFSFQGFQ